MESSVPDGAEQVPIAGVYATIKAKEREKRKMNLVRQ